MSGFSAYASRKALDHIVGKTPWPMPTAYLALFTATGLDDGTGFTEVAGGSYSRITTSQIDWNAASGVAPAFNSNYNDLSFPVPTWTWGTILAFGLYDQPTGGDLLAWDYLGDYSWLPVTISPASPAVVTHPAHGYSASDNVVFTTEYGGVAPTLSAGSFGLLSVVSPTTNSYTLQNGATALNASTPGNGNIRKVIPVTINELSGRATFAAGNLKLYLA